MTALTPYPLYEVQPVGIAPTAPVSKSSQSLYVRPAHPGKGPPSPPPLPPVEAPRYYYNLAYAHFKLGELDRARSLAERARQVTRNPDEMERVDRLLKQMQVER